MSDYQLIYKFNKTETSYPDIRTIQELFEEQVEKIPDNCAVICDTKRLSYRELNIRANQLAHYLRKFNLGPDDIIGIMADRSAEMIIGIWGIIKAGCAYLPVAPDSPVERINYMLLNSETKILLVQDKYLSCVNFKGMIINLNNADVQNTPFDNPLKINSPHDLLYVIYTSGSTGKPKGVMIEHQSLINRLNWMQNYFPLAGNDVILQKTPFYFDVSVWELFWWSLNGAMMCFLTPGGEKFPTVIIETIEKNRVSVIHFVPSMLNVFLEYIESRNDLEIRKLGSLKQVFTSGEVLSPFHLKKFNRLIGNKIGTGLTNLYGPTEATIDVTYYNCPRDENIEKVPIGKPIDNTKIFIMKNNKMLDVGQTGEICIAGTGVSRGYINNERLTAEKFVDCPFLQGTKMYKSGDFGRWLPDGNIEFLGREDFQVKIRGLRIELGEIESSVRNFPGVKDCIVTVKQYSETVIVLTAYIITAEKIKSQKLKNYLRQYLPDYMIPGNIIEIDEIPLTPNGKADRNALPDPLSVLT